MPKTALCEISNFLRFSKENIFDISTAVPGNVLETKEGEFFMKGDLILLKLSNLGKFLDDCIRSFISDNYTDRQGKSYSQKYAYEIPKLYEKKIILALYYYGKMCRRLIKVNRILSNIIICEERKKYFEDSENKNWIQYEKLRLEQIEKAKIQLIEEEKKSEKYIKNNYENYIGDEIILKIIQF